jgi:hypothetical protein
MCEKLEPYRGKNIPVDVNEEFRLTTLQVIGEAVLSMSPEECDKVGNWRERHGDGAGWGCSELAGRPGCCSGLAGCCIDARAARPVCMPGGLVQ